MEFLIYNFNSQYLLALLLCNFFPFPVVELQNFCIHKSIYRQSCMVGSLLCTVNASVSKLSWIHPSGNDECIRIDSLSCYSTDNEYKVWGKPYKITHRHFHASVDVVSPEPSLTRGVMSSRVYAQESARAYSTPYREDNSRRLFLCTSKKNYCI